MRLSMRSTQSTTHQRPLLRTFSIGNDIEITPREIAFGVAILFILVALGFVIAGQISNNVRESNEVYYTALKIDNDQPKMEYALRTNVGHALVYGEIKATTPVSFPELTKKYLYTEKIKERYTMHTRTVTTTDGKGHTQTHVEIYYTWDYAGSSSVCTDTFNFLGGTYPINKINLPGASVINLSDRNMLDTFISRIRGSYLYDNGNGLWTSVGDIRYYYKGIPTSFMATLFVDVKNKTITGVNSSRAETFCDAKIPDVIAMIDAREKSALVLFWILYGLVSCGLVFGFFALSNNWLEDK